MKRIFYFIILSANFAFAQNFNWITPNKAYLKMYVADDGMYRINKSDFTNAGVNTSSIDPRTVKVFYKGAQIPVYFFGEQDGVFNDNDYLDFYGQRNYGGSTISYKEVGASNVTDYVTNEYYNLYSDTSVYWVGWDGTNGLRYTDYSYSSSNLFGQNYFYSSLQFEKDLVYSLGERRNSQDFRNFNNEKISGEGWYWREMQRGNFVSDTFRTPYLSDIPQNCLLKVFAYPNSYNDTLLNEHRLIIRVNNNIVDTLETDNYNKIDTTITFSSTLLSNTNINTISITYTGAGTYVGRMLFDFFGLQYPRKFSFENNRMSFRTSSNDTATVKFKAASYNAANELSIYDVKNNYRITSFTNINDTLFYSGKQNGKFEILNTYISKKPLRIKQRQVPNLLTNSTGVDYLIVYNKLLEVPAENLKQYRFTHDGFRSAKVEIEDIYDVFNFGMEHPVAVRYFVKNVYDTWQQPKVKYLCLFGRGSLDPKKNSSGSIYYQNLIPVYGNPASDGYFANFNLGAFTYYHQISVGRIPALTQLEGNDIVNNIIQYESQTHLPAGWFKNFIFISGGQTVQEQNEFASKSEYFINNYIKPPPTSGYPVRIYRNDSTGYVTYNYRDSIKNAINVGGMIVNYIGHAGSSTWDTGLDDPNVLSNQTRMPVVFSMTCFTGKNAEADFRSFGEKFMNMPNKGAIGFIGTTGWSYSGSGNTFNEYMLKSFSKDTVRRIGDIVRYASRTMSPDSLYSSASKNTINCYGMLGDPAAKLLLPNYPEFAIEPADYKFSNPFPAIRELIKLTAYPRNYGINADSVKIRFQIFRNSTSYGIKDTVLYNFGLIDTLNYNFTLDSAGNYSVLINIDPDTWNTKEEKFNNRLSIPIALKNLSFIPLKPVDNQVIPTDSVEVVGINPNVDLKNNTVRLILQIDSSRNYNSGLSRTYFVNNPNGLVTRFKVPVPVKDTNIVYFFRMNAIINSDSSGWSEVRRFICGNSPIEINSFKNPSLYSDQIVSIYKKKVSQYNSSDLFNASGITDSIVVSQYTGIISAQSWGNNISEQTLFTIGIKEHRLLDSAYWGGLNIIKLNKVNARIIDSKHFNFNTTLSNDSALNYLNTFNDQNILLIIKAVPFNTNFGMSSSLKSKIKLFGSTAVDSVNLQTFSCWSFISYSQFPNVIKSEKYSSVYAPAVCSMQPVFYYDSAYVYNSFIPAKSYGSFKWSGIVPQNTYLYFDVNGINHQNALIPLYRNLTSNSFVSLDTVSTASFPGVRLVTKLYVDSLNGIQSPVFSNLRFTYTPAAEIIADNYSFVKSDSVFQDGDTLNISVSYGNFGYANALGVVNKWTATSPNGLKVLRIDTVSNVLKIDSMASSVVKLSTIGLRNPNTLSDTITLFFETSLINLQNEFFTYNNTAVTRIVIKGDTARPVMDITYDGVKANSGEYISTRPKIVLTFLDDSKIFIKDTSNIRVQLDDTTVWYYINGAKNPLIDLQFAYNKYLQATLYFNPVLADGEHKFRYVSYDNNNNYADTVTHYLSVNPELKIMDLKNFPNPMKNQTNFIVNLSGNLPPSMSKIKIFTVAGRLIKTIETPLNIGYNQIFWDGRDADGDYIANGVYFYKLIIEGNSKKETALQKLVVLK
jgi:hypothetical protein